MKSVAVITSTIGRAELVGAIESVQQQSYPCKHYVFVDGEQFHAQAKAILDRYPNVVAIYLPMNTGADGWTNSSINAIAPYLVKEDIICYLDDDNWFQPDHIASGVTCLEESGCHFAYALRNLYDFEGNFLSKDTIESIGFYQAKVEYPVKINLEYQGNVYPLSFRLNKPSHIDTNCFFFPRTLAIQISQHWFSGIHNDTNVWKHLKDSQLTGACTKQFSVNYRFEPKKFMNFKGISNDELSQVLSADSTTYLIIQYLNKLNLDNHGGVYPWESGA